MEQIAVTLTREDHMILESYKTLAEGLSDYLGSSYEIVLHSLEDLDRSVIKILNGYHTGRREGAPITDLALEMLSRIGWAFGVMLAFFDLRQKYDYLKATFDILRDENTSLLGIIKNIEIAYDEMDADDFREWADSTKHFDRLLAALPDRAWLE